MIAILVAWVSRALVIMTAGYLLSPKVFIANFWTALVVVLFLAVVNAVLKPILIILTLPINVLTLGLFTVVINALLISLIDWMVPEFSIYNFWWAIVFGIVVSVLNFILYRFLKQ